VIRAALTIQFFRATQPLILFEANRFIENLKLRRWPMAKEAPPIEYSRTMEILKIMQEQQVQLFMLAKVMRDSNAGNPTYATIFSRSEGLKKRCADQISKQRGIDEERAKAKAAA